VSSCEHSSHSLLASTNNLALENSLPEAVQSMQGVQILGVAAHTCSDRWLAFERWSSRVLT